MRPLALALALFATAAQAQAPSTGVPSPGMGLPPPDPAANAFVAEPGAGLRASKLAGVDVIDLDFKKVGEVRDVLIGRDGRVEAVVLAVGGFLGIGEKDIAVRFEHFLWNTGASALNEGPSASMRPDQAPPPPDAQAAAERMPGAGVNQDVVVAVPGTSPVTEGSGAVLTTGSTPTSTVIAGGGTPRRAQVRLTRQQIEGAPAFSLEGRR
jgi:hypothetical protein